MRPRHALLAGALLALGCHDPVTEIVLVVDSDLSTPGEVSRLEFQIDPPAGSFMRDEFDLHAGAFPATVGLVPGDAAGYGPFDVRASLFATPGALEPVLTRKVSGVRFERGAVRMLYLPLRRACACQGTSCPNALQPDCADLASPTLAAFDPAHLPRLPSTDGGAAGGGGAGGSGGAAGAGGGGGAIGDAAVDVPTERPPDAGRDEGGEAPTDGPRDLADTAEAAPAKLPRGHACGPGDVCTDGFCVDGVCCQSACTCGECASTPGFCTLAAAGTDPRGACGDYACNGAGACETTCPETFGACSSRCSPNAHCDGAGKCTASTTGAGFFCVVGSCMCKPPLTCPAPDGGGAGVCR
jgi:hypothetical protein